MDDDLQIFKDAMSEEGIDADITSHEDPKAMSIIYTIRANINGEVMIRKRSISERERTRVDDMQQHIAQIASMTARDFSSYMRERVEWGDKAVVFDSSEAYQATCLRCGSSVSTDDLDGHTRSVAMAESTVPHPPTPDYESLPKHKLQMVLLAALRRECEMFCPNSDTPKHLSR